MIKGKQFIGPQITQLKYGTTIGMREINIGKQRAPDLACKN